MQQMLNDTVTKYVYRVKQVANSNSKQKKYKTSIGVWIVLHLTEYLFDYINERHKNPFEKNGIDFIKNSLRTTSSKGLVSNHNAYDTICICNIFLLDGLDVKVIFKLL